MSLDRRQKRFLNVCYFVLRPYFEPVLEASTSVRQAISPPTPYYGESQYEGLIVRMERDVLVYKKVKLGSHQIVIPLVLERGTAVRLSIRSPKCRAQHLICEGLRAQRYGGEKAPVYYTQLDRTPRSGHRNSFLYEPGPLFPQEDAEQVLKGMKSGDECGPGIHFFFGYTEASRYFV